MLSGIGADEIMAKIFLALWLLKLTLKIRNIYPRDNFFYGSQENYIRGQDYIGGCFNFETRYPFLDKKVVLKFLSLSPKQKNGNNNKIVLY